MKYIKTILLSLTLLVPLSYTVETKTLRNDETLALATFGTIFIGIPVAIGSYFLYKKIRLANRTDEEVYNEAELYLKETKLKYDEYVAMVEKITPELTYQQTLALHTPIIEKINLNKCFFNSYPLLTFINTLSSNQTELRNHAKWLEERIIRFDTELEADFISKFTGLVEELKTDILNFGSLYLLIYNSTAY